MKTMIIGLQPDYVYPGTLEEWSKSNTFYAANLGASLICNSLIRQFDADYISEFNNVSELRKKYDVCVLALATHLHPSRDISLFTELVRKLDMKTIILSIGLRDYNMDVSTDYELHPSVSQLLEFVSKSSNWIGVRGHYSAALLHRKGFRNVVPIGCPSFYWGMNRKLQIHKKDEFSRPLVPYHFTLAKACPEFIADKPLLGQDFQDEILFTDNLKNDHELRKWIEKQYGPLEKFEVIKKSIRSKGIFKNKFTEWFDFIGQHDFVIGPRLHGCISGIIQGIPTVMTVRDLRVREIVEFFKLPAITYDKLKTNTLKSIYALADYENFNELFPIRYNNYVKFLKENELKHSFRTEAQSNFIFTCEDLISANYIAQWQIQELHTRLSDIETSEGLRAAKMIYKYLSENKTISDNFRL